VNQIDKYPKIKVVDISMAPETISSAEIADPCSGPPKLKGIFGTNEGSAIGTKGG
jgi:hypothetical protein